MCRTCNFKQAFMIFHIRLVILNSRDGKMRVSKEQRADVDEGSINWMPAIITRKWAILMCWVDDMRRNVEKERRNPMIHLYN